MGTVKKDIFTGIFASVFASFGSFFLYLEYFSRFGFYETLEMIQRGNLIGKVMSLCAIPSMLVFFIFIQKRQDNRAKGVLMMVILIALTTVILKFF